MAVPLSRRTLARKIAPNVDAALHNEQVTRQRVTDAENRLEKIETWATTTGDAVQALAQSAAAVEAILGGNWRRRLRWLVTGR